MVSNNVIITRHGKRFLHSFATSMKVTEDRIHKLTVPEDLTMDMTLTGPDKKAQNWTYGHGLVQGFRNDGTVVVVVSVNDTRYLPAGDYSYKVTAKDGAGNKILDEKGTIKVESAVVTREPDPAASTWFDPFTPVTQSTDGEVHDLPEPEIPLPIYEERMNLCMACPALDNGSICKQCGCFMPVKAGLADVSCPLGKWGPHV